MTPRLELLWLIFGLVITGCLERTVQKDDHPLLIKVADLSVLDLSYANPSASETLTRTLYLDGSQEIDYEFDSPEDAEQPLFMTSTAAFERSASEARKMFTIEWLAVKAGAELGGLEIKLKEDFFRYGDESHFAVLAYEGMELGNLFCTRSGNKIYSFLMTGVAIEDREMWDALVASRLAYLESYNPGWWR